MAKRGTISNTNLERFMTKFVKTPGCWIWTAAKAGNGYGYFYYNGHLRYAHRVSLTLFKGYELENDLDTLHSCDNPSCVNPDHLSYGTRTQNMRDASSRGRTVNVNDWSGTNNPKSKLTESDRKDVENMIINGVKTKVIADKFNISTVRVSQISRTIEGFSS